MMLLSIPPLFFSKREHGTSQYLCRGHSNDPKNAEFGRATKGMLELADDIPLLLFASAKLKLGTGFIPQTTVCVLVRRCEVL